MTKNRMTALVAFLLIVVSVGCASAGMKKPTVFVDQYNNVPADIPSQFPNRYERYISGKELKEFKKLLTDEERQVFIDKFWLDRDTNPSTPENEYKQEVDERIDSIANESFLSTPSVFGLSFRTNGGFRGDMAKVYLLHGEPDAMDTIESERQLFVPLMLWAYSNPENNNVLFFLFYQKGSSGPFSLFYQDSYKMDQCGAIYEVATLRNYNYESRGGGKNCPDDLYEVYNNIYQSTGRGGWLDGNIFAWALFNFSNNPSLNLDKALDPPKPALEVAKKSKARVVGEAPELTGTAGTDYILSSCEGCNSMIPAELSTNGKLAISAPWKNFDWAVKGDRLELSLKYRIIIYVEGVKLPMVAEGVSVTEINKKFVEDNPDLVFTINLFEPWLGASIPAGTYRISVYIKSTLTPKYNAWDREITK